MNQTIASPQINERSPFRVIWDTAAAWFRSGLSSAPFRLITAGTRALSSQLGFGFIGALDTERLSAKLAVERRGSSDGELDLPASTEEVIVGTQLEIVAYFRELRRAMLKQFKVLTTRLRRYREKIEHLDSIDRVRIIPQECEKKIRRLIAANNSKLNVLAERQLQQLRHYEAFRENNQLERVAETRLPIVYYCFVAALAVLGAVILGNISIATIDGTVYLSRSWALAVSGLGITVPFVLATAVFRSVNHVRDLRRLIGWSGGVSALVVITLTAFVLAHYITAIGAGSELTMRALWASIVTSPIAVDGNSSVIASVAVVLMFGLLAFVAGYQSEDPYPGYAAVQRSYYRARDRRERLLMNLRMRVNKTIDEAESELSKTSRHLKSYVRKYSSLIEKVKAASACLVQDDIALDETCNILLSRYRAANVKARKSTTPLCFSEYACLTNHPDVATQIESAMRDDRLEEFSRRIDELGREMGQARQKIMGLQQRVISDLEGVLGANQTMAEELSR